MEEQADAPLVLVVEDEPLLRTLLSDVLSETGFSVVEARNGDEALRVLEEGSNVRVLFTDVDMPGSLDGFKLARMTRDRWPSVAILIVSGHMRPGVEDMPPGGFFITKPFRPATIARQVRAALAGASAG